MSFVRFGCSHGSVKRRLCRTLHWGLPASSPATVLMRLSLCCLRRAICLDSIPDLGNNSWNTSGVFLPAYHMQRSTPNCDIDWFFMGADSITVVERDLGKGGGGGLEGGDSMSGLWCKGKHESRLYLMECKVNVVHGYYVCKSCYLRRDECSNHCRTVLKVWPSEVYNLCKSRVSCVWVCKP